MSGRRENSKEPEREDSDGSDEGGAAGGCSLSGVARGKYQALVRDDDVPSEDDFSMLPRRKPIPLARKDGSGVAAGGSREGGGGRTGAVDKVAKLPIQIRTMTGKTYKIEARVDWNVQRLKQEFEYWHGGNADMCSLYFKAKKLQDNNTLISYNIGAGDYVMANYRSVGGL